jgi:DtxR family manganese transport transcriptional regulator
MTSAERHDRVRRQHADELAHDYVEALHVMLGAGAPVRVTDLCGVFGVSHVSVIRALRRLGVQGLVRQGGEKGIRLTPQGEAVARSAAERHALLVRFLRELGVSAEQADADAEGAEHHLSAETYAAIRRFLEGLH